MVGLIRLRVVSCFICLFKVVDRRICCWVFFLLFLEFSIFKIVLIFFLNFKLSNLYKCSKIGLVILLIMLVGDCGLWISFFLDKGKKGGKECYIRNFVLLLFKRVINKLIVYML